jgi:hypothetical protein
MGRARTYRNMSAPTLSRCALPSGGPVCMHQEGARGVRAQRRGGSGVSSGARVSRMAAPVVQVVDMLWAEAGHGNVAHLQAGAAEAWPPLLGPSAALVPASSSSRSGVLFWAAGGRSGRAAPFCFRRVFDRATTSQVPCGAPTDPSAATSHHDRATIQTSPSRLTVLRSWSMHPPHASPG